MPKEQYQKRIQAKPKGGLTLVDSMVLQTVKQPDSTWPPGLSTHSRGGGTQFNIWTKVPETQKTIALKVDNEDSWRQAYRHVSAMNPSAPVGAVVFCVAPKGDGKATTTVEWSTLAGHSTEESQGWSPQEEILYQALLLKRSIASAASAPAPAPADHVDHRPTFTFQTNEQALDAQQTREIATTYEGEMQRYYQRFYHRSNAPRDSRGGHGQNGMASLENGTILANGFAGSVVSESISAVPPMDQNQSQNQAHGPARPQARGQAADTQEQEQLSRQGEGPNPSEEVPGSSNRQGQTRRLAIAGRAVSVAYGFRSRGLTRLCTKVENLDAGGPQNDIIARVPDQWNMWVGKCSCAEVCQAMYNVVKAMDPKVYHILTGISRDSIPFSQTPKQTERGRVDGVLGAYGVPGRKSMVCDGVGSATAMAEDMSSDGVGHEASDLPSS
ncbi:hypothetical protein FDECE_4472 [Fusarium decemcellulare]|nr:hypothetical protein FDECE_4472 [Fusarium decemcellulare]